jgi:endonuclease IV
VNNINLLFNRIKNEIDPNLNYFGLCVDTAHLWSCGVDLSDYLSAETWLNELNIDPKCLMIHCNDNEKNIGIAPDIHTSLTDGKIWNNYKNNLQDSGLMAILKYCKKYEIPIILERHPMELLFNDYVIIQQLI